MPQGPQYSASHQNILEYAFPSAFWGSLGPPWRTGKSPPRDVTRSSGGGGGEAWKCHRPVCFLSGRRRYKNNTAVAHEIKITWDRECVLFGRNRQGFGQSPAKVRPRSGQSMTSSFSPRFPSSSFPHGLLVVMAAIHIHSHVAYIY